MGVRLTNYHCIIDTKDPVAAESTDKCKTAQSSPLTVYRKTFMTSVLVMMSVLRHFRCERCLQPPLLAPIICYFIY